MLPVRASESLALEARARLGQRGLIESWSIRIPRIFETFWNSFKIDLKSFLQQLPKLPRIVLLGARPFVPKVDKEDKPKVIPKRKAKAKAKAKTKAAAKAKAEPVPSPKAPAKKRK